MNTTLFDALSSRRERVIALQKGMTAIPAIGPDEGGIGEWDKAQWLETTMRSYGITAIERLDIQDARVPSGKRPNMIATIKGKTDKTLWILVHMDVVPPGDAELWLTNPFELHIDPKDDDILRGRGVEDNQQSIVAVILIAAELLEHKIIPDLNLSIIFVADEETHNTYGIDHILKIRPNLIKDGDLVLVPDFGTQDGKLICVAEKGVLWLQVSIFGKQCHASTPDEGKNTLVAAAHMITRVADVEKAFDKRNSLFSPDRSTLIPTRHDGNVPNINTISGKEVFFIDCRILPEYTLDEVFHEIQQLGIDIAQTHGVQVLVKKYNSHPTAPSTSVDSEVVVKLQDAIKKVYSIDSLAGGIGASTVAGSLRRHGVAAAVWSSALPNYHQPNEGSRISYAIGDAQVFSHLLFNDPI